MALLTDSTQLDWTAALAAARSIAAQTSGPARDAAERIVRSCESAGYTPPEALDIHVQRVRSICTELDEIARVVGSDLAPEIDAITDALLITPPPAVFS